MGSDQVESMSMLPSNQLDALSEYTFITKYARYDHKKKRRETWSEAIDRVRDMHLQRYGSKGIDEDITWAFEQVRDRRVLPSMRSMQFGGDAIIANDARMYNCSYSLADRARFFSEAFWLLLSGSGIGFSVQKQHVAKLPKLIQHKPSDEKEVFTYVVPDTIEGWADALDILMSTYFQGTPNSGREVFFDFTRIRRKGTWLKTSGGRAPGAKPLQIAIKLIKKVLREAIEAGQPQLKPIQVYDITTMAADAVVSGGIRRSATLCLFSEDDQEMMTAKTFYKENVKVLSDKRKDNTWLTECGIAWKLERSDKSEPANGDFVNISWSNIMPWRGRSNNSVALLRSKCSKEQFKGIVTNSKLYGEPGFIFLENLDHGYNPCVTADTLVATDNGMRTVNELIGKPFTALVNGDLYPSVASGFIQTGIQKIKKVKFASGRQLRATENHPVMTDHGWTPIWDLQTGAKVLVHDHSGRQFETNKNHDYHRGLLMGWFIGDGNVCKRSRNDSAQVKFWGENKDTSRDYAREVIDLAGWSNANRHTAYSHASGGTATSVYSVLECKPLYDYAKQLGVLGDRQEKGMAKHISHQLESQPTEFVCGFLRGYFDSDGSVNVGSKSRFSIRLCSNKLSNLQAAQRMLNYIGIDSSIVQERYPARVIDMPDGHGGMAPYACQATHDLIISRKSIVRFANLVGFSDTNKADKLTTIVNKKFADPIFVDRVTEVIDDGFEPVFDCEIPDIHAFDANGLYVHNCVEIGLNPIDVVTKETGWGVCNLTEINGGKIKSREDFRIAVKAATLIGTLQAGYTYLSYLTDATRRIVRRERLLGVSVTGWMEDPELLLDPALQQEMARYAIEVNQEYADKIGIERAARVTCTKPSGSSSLILGTASGIHPHHSFRYFRRAQANAVEYPLQFFKLFNPQAVERSVWVPDGEVITFCVEVAKTARIKDQFDAVEFLKIVKSTYENWVVPGTALPNSSPGLTHNVSNTVRVAADEWDQVSDFIYDNRQCFSGVSLLPKAGDKIYRQAPMERIDSVQDVERWNQLVESYSPVDWSKLDEPTDNTSFLSEGACVGGACELT